MDLAPLQVLFVLSLSLNCLALEVGIPERFLRPRDYNPHPGDATAALTSRSAQAVEYASIDADQTILHQVLPEDLPHPYALFQRPPVHRGESSTAPIQFPKVPDTPAEPEGPRLKDSFSRSRFVSPLGDSPLNSLSYKNYAFSYKVQDHGSGDDFSHSQAHKAGATKGEYRVRLPDGRIQVVSYTADETGYRADVRYDHDNHVDSGYTEPKLSRPITSLKQVSYAKNPTSYEDLYPYLQHLDSEDYPDEKDALYAKTPIRYVKSGSYPQGYPYFQKDHTPIHEDYPDIPPPDKEHAPRATPQPEPRYLLPSPSPTPAYISPKPNTVLLALASPSPAPHKVLVLPHQIKPYHPYDQK